MSLLFPDRGSASLTLAFHARHCWHHRESVRKALEEGDDTCCCCSTRIPGWMEIHHVNGNHDDWRVENLAPICHFCHLARHPAQPGFGRGEFPLEIVWWPELTQAAIMAFSWSIFWLRALAQQDDDVAGKVGACLNGVSNEISRRTRQGREAGGARLPADLLSAAGEEEPAHWQSLRFLPVEIRSSGQRWQSAELHRFLAGGFDRFPLVSVVDAEIENLSFWLLKLVGAMLTGGEEA